MVEWGHNIKWKFTNWFTSNYLWPATTYFRSYPHSVKHFYLYWLNIYRPTKFSCWCSSIPTHKLSSPNNLLQLQPYHWISTSLSTLGLDYKRANVNSIKQALYQVNWSTTLSNKDVHQQVNILNSIILNVFTNYVSNKVITISDKDLSWMADFIT